MTTGVEKSRVVVAIGVLFFVNGFGWAGWIPRIPEIQDQLGLGVAALGWVLAGYGAGGLLGSSTGGIVIDRFGSRTSAGIGAVGIAIALPLLALAPNQFWLAAAFVVAGAVDALADMAMNVQGADAQRAHGGWIMNRFHATWSVGTVAGAVVGSSVAQAGIGLATHLTVVAVGVAIAAIWAVKRLPLVDSGVERQTNRTVTRRAVVLGLLAVAVSIPEGAASDWSAVFFGEVHDFAAGQVGYGFVAFSVAMLVGRLTADFILERTGPIATVRVSTAIAVAGMVMVTTAPSSALSIAGFVLFGLGLAALFPMLYNAAASRETTSAGTGLAVMTTGGRMGFLIGPAVIGQLSGIAGLRVGLGVATVVPVVVVFVLARRFSTG